MASEHTQAIRTVDCVVPDTLTTPDVGVDLGRRVLVGVFIPAAAEGTTLGFTVCETLGGTYLPLMSGGSNLSITVAPGRYVALDPDVFRGVRFVKPVLAAQTGAVTLTLVAR